MLTNRIWVAVYNHFSVTFPRYTPARHFLLHRDFLQDEFLILLYHYI
jgi:hypothetical protein